MWEDEEMKKADSDALEKARLQKDLEVRKNHTFRMRDDLYVEFIKICKKNDVSAAKVLENFLEDFIMKHGK